MAMTHADARRRCFGREQQLSVKLRDLARAGAVISQAADAGGDATRIRGLSFDIEDDSALLAQARRKAFDEAKAAELYAQASGRGLGRVVSINESVAAPDAGRQASAAAAAAVAKPVPILPGEHASQSPRASSGRSAESATTPRQKHHPDDQDASRLRNSHGNAESADAMVATWRDLEPLS
jgi:hypothetical protein